MNCPHCGKAIESGVNGATDVVPTYVNLNNANGCNPMSVITWIPNVTGANPTTFQFTSLNLGGAANAGQLNFVVKV